MIAVACGSILPAIIIQTLNVQRKLIMRRTISKLIIKDVDLLVYHDILGILVIIKILVLILKNDHK